MMRWKRPNLDRNKSMVRRARIYKYVSSGRPVALLPGGQGLKARAIDFSSDMRRMLRVGSVTYITNIVSTEYEVEVREPLAGKDDGNEDFEYRLIRVLTQKDTQANLWLSGQPLSVLPVSPDEDYTPEELCWSGKRDGNIGGGIFLVAPSLGAAAGSAIYAFSGNREALWLSVTSFAMALALMGRYPWRRSRLPSPEKLQELSLYKRDLRVKQQTSVLAVRTEFERTLSTFSGWEKLDPASFELGISMRLEAEGYTVNLTQYSKDGGVDIEATDTNGRPVIVQAKRYRGAVGVSVVREMLGIRACRSDLPDLIIFSLMGFTRGARKLASASGVQLRDIKSELLGL